jgi:small conductance mechanosensitive channel
MKAADLAWLEQHDLLLRIAQKALGLVAISLGALLSLWVVKLLASRTVAKFSTDDTAVQTLEQVERKRRVETIVRVGTDVVRVFVWGFVILTVLSQFGVSVQPLVAGAGLIGAAVAFGSQAIVKDYAAGFFILLENHFDIGDSIAIGTTSGTVEKMTLRVTVLRDADGAIHIIPNGTIAIVTNKSNRWNNARVTVTVDPNAEPAAVRKALAEAAVVLTYDEAHTGLWLESVNATGPLALKEAGVEWSLSAKVPVGKVGTAQPLLLEGAQTALIAAGVKMTLKG